MNTRRCAFLRVPSQVFGAANKFALMEVAKKWADTLKIEWVEEEVAVS